MFDNQQAGTGQLRHNPLRLPNGGLTGTANLNRSSGGLGALPTYVTQSTPWDGSGGVNRSSSTTVLPADVAHSMMLATPSGFPIATPFTRYVLSYNLNHTNMYPLLCFFNFHTLQSITSC